MNSLQIVFEGVRGYGSQGDIGLDDVSLKSGACPGIGSCDFETGLCGYTQRRNDNFDWLRKAGSTPTVNTGPRVDHTLGSTTGELWKHKTVDRSFVKPYPISYQF